MTPIEYDDPPAAAEFGARVRTFVEEVVLPADRDRPAGEIPPETVDRLRREARERGLYAPTVPEEYGGLGLDLRTALPAIEEVARSVLGPPAIRVGSPDQANMHLLDIAGTAEQKERWLRPIAAGELRSGFAITEPSPGAGSDPSMLKTAAERDGGGWIVDGHKWWTTQGADADVLIVVARTDPDADVGEGCSLFLVPTDAEGVEVVRELPAIGQHGAGGHAEIVLDGVRVPAEALLGGENRGLEHARRRVPVSRLARYARSAGMAVRALDAAKAYATEREASGEPLAEKGAIRFEIAEAEARVHAARTLIRDTADRMADAAGGDDDGNGGGALELAMCGVVAAEASEDAVGTAVSVCGANGVGKDLPVAEFYERLRPTGSGIAGAGHKRRIADAVFDPDAVDSEELDPMVRFRSRRGA